MAWNVLDIGFVKINVDVAIYNTINITGIEGIARDHLGKMLGGFSTPIRGAVTIKKA